MSRPKSAIENLPDDVLFIIFAYAPELRAASRRLHAAAELRDRHLLLHYLSHGGRPRSKSSSSSSSSANTTAATTGTAPPTPPSPESSVSLSSIATPSVFDETVLLERVRSDPVISAFLEKVSYSTSSSLSSSSSSRVSDRALLALFRRDVCFFDESHIITPRPDAEIEIIEDPSIAVTPSASAPEPPSGTCHWQVVRDPAQGAPASGTCVRARGVHWLWLQHRTRLAPGFRYRILCSLRASNAFALNTVRFMVQENPYVRQAFQPYAPVAATAGQHGVLGNERTAGGTMYLGEIDVLMPPSPGIVVVEGVRNGASGAWVIGSSDDDGDEDMDEADEPSDMEEEEEEEVEEEVEEVEVVVSQQSNVNEEHRQNNINTEPSDPSSSSSFRYYFMHDEDDELLVSEPSTAGGGATPQLPIPGVSVGTMTGLTSPPHTVVVPASSLPRTPSGVSGNGSHDALHHHLQLHRQLAQIERERSFEDAVAAADDPAARARAHRRLLRLRYGAHGSAAYAGNSSLSVSVSTSVSGATTPKSPHFTERSRATSFAAMARARPGSSSLSTSHIPSLATGGVRTSGSVGTAVATMTAAVSQTPGMRAIRQAQRRARKLEAIAAAARPAGRWPQVVFDIEDTSVGINRGLQFNSLWFEQVAPLQELQPRPRDWHAVAPGSKELPTLERLGLVTPDAREVFARFARHKIMTGQS
ncbi:uncharacterized protein SAPINGB_P002161 [Magnusiomyces paraingens]|uniref:Uncharacterized protein n=1 Tax=Magnusiomyces paraingens TaxID=2606893 RepID=A0A5E8BI52_9ASCO|nr:uncharacterized protein SAPINGB_P002161 [Saprochaete ingens]VVT49218.1 unnamed protein product [Saprochaete ingens]